MNNKFWFKTGTLLAIITLSIRFLASSQWIEHYYSRVLFPLFRFVYDTFIGSWLPVALIYVFIPLFFFFVARNFIRWIKSPNKGKGLRAISGLLNFVGWIVGLFLLLWGFNYKRVPVEQQIGFEANGLLLEELKASVQSEALILQTLRTQITQADSHALSAQHFPADMEKQLRTAIEKTLNFYNFPTVGAPRARVLAPKGVLLRISTAGIYFPWVFEAHIDAGLLHLQRPYTMTHELAHAYGFGDEGTCSFWAYLSAFNTDNVSLQYAIRLGYWRSIAGRWLRADPEGYLAFRQTLAAGMIADIDAINENIEAYPDIFPQVRDVAYDAYLKAQGIQEGLQNYGRVINLVEAWRKSEGASVFDN